MNLDQVAFLSQDDTSAFINTLEVSHHNHLQVAAQLRKTWSAEQTHAILETAILRRKAKSKFAQAERMLFTRSGLEQSSGDAVANYRAEKFFAGGYDQVADLCCGIGGDSLAFAQQANVTGVDFDAVRLAMAVRNTYVLGVHHRFNSLKADLTTLNPLKHVDAFFFDPGRRTAAGKRIYRLSEYHPPVSMIKRWLACVPDGGIKISPGVDYAELPEPDQASVEFISVNGQVREAVLWYGGLKGQVSRCATLLPSGVTLVERPEVPPAAVGPLKRWLYEPDGAVIRAHLIKELAVLLNGNQIDGSIALITADHCHLTPFAQRFKVTDSMPFQLKKLRQYLRQHHIGRIVVKKRGSPLDPQWLEKQLKPKGDKAATLFLTQLAGEPIVVICQQA